jgi:hypothetical protein
VKQWIFGVMSLAAVGCYESSADPALSGVVGNPVQSAGSAGVPAPAPEAPTRSGNAKAVATCAAFPIPDDWMHLTVDQPAFHDIGGAGAQLSATCTRCGWSSRSDQCQSLVYSVPTIDNSNYQACFLLSSDFAHCVETESCVCGGTLPSKCQQLKAAIETCAADTRSNPSPMQGSAGVGADGCVAVADQTRFDRNAFGDIGGAGVTLAGSCTTCGWASSSALCQERVNTVPRGDHPYYDACLVISEAWADCVDSQRCACTEAIPAACGEFKQKLDACLIAQH